MDEQLKKEIRKIALQNAYEHGGETQGKIVLGKILGAKSELRTKVKEIKEDIEEIVISVNQSTVEEMKNCKQICSTRKSLTEIWKTNSKNLNI